MGLLNLLLIILVVVLTAGVSDVIDEKNNVVREKNKEPISIIVTNRESRVITTKDDTVELEIKTEEESTPSNLVFAPYFRDEGFFSSNY